MPEQFSEADSAAEIERLRAKQSTIDDEDIRLALQARIDALESELKQSKKVEDDEPAEEAVQQATPEQMTQADNMIRQAKVEKMRGNSARASTLMKEAAAVAPSSPTVLEAVADDLFDRRMFKDALVVYKRALKFDPKNVGIEKKHAQCALRAGGMGSIDQQLRSGLGDSMLISSSDNVASVKAARFLNAIVPGVGHMVLGRSTTGITILLIYVAAIGMIVAMHKDVEGIVRMMKGMDTHPSLLVMVPTLIAAITWIGAQAALGVETRGSARKTIDRPMPPVDLPFE